MKVSKYPQPKASEFYTTYIQDYSQVASFFPYSWDHTEWKKRLNDMEFSKEKRNALVTTLRMSMSSVKLSAMQEENLRLLKDNAVVTIAGQQTGLLTGPFYSIHKAITAIVLARQISAETKLPVVPVFWMAGEDHDILEVNHFFLEKNREVAKFSLGVQQLSTQMVGSQSIDVHEFKGLLNQAFQALPETAHTKDLYTELVQLIEQQPTYKDFFLHAFQQFFSEYGLLIVNSSDEAMREMGKEFTIQLIESNQQLRQSVYQTEQQISASGYGFPIQCRIENAHLFYVKDNHRYLLEATDEGFANKELNQHWTKEQLINELQDNPSIISHNVVTRPLMQQYIFPVHSFIGGPGEIAYWALLKDAFSIMKLKMPIVSPRFSITVLPLSIEEKMKELHITLEQVWDGEIPLLQQRFIDSQKNEHMKQQLMDMNKWLEESYKHLSHVLSEESIKLDPLLEKNKANHAAQFEFLTRSIEDVYYRRFDATIAKFQAIQNELVPNHSLQERIYSPLHYLNWYGPGIIDQLVELPYKLDGKHYVMHNS